MSYWLAYDAITFLIDIGMYKPAFHDFLTDEEKEYELRFKPVISRRRFVVSRAILKHILAKILPKIKFNDIVLIRDNDGRIHVKDKPHVYICLSYYGTSIVITVGNIKIGSDIVRVRPLLDKKITASPIFCDYQCAQGEEGIRMVIHIWTLVESYAKLYDTNPYPLLNSCLPFKNAEFLSYYIDQHMIFSLASIQKNLTDVLVWLDV
jgi:4'-phosphopantetheinyl transferase